MEMDLPRPVPAPAPAPAPTTMADNIGSHPPSLLQFPPGFDATTAAVLEPPPTPSSFPPTRLQALTETVVRIGSWFPVAFLLGALAVTFYVLVRHVAPAQSSAAASTAALAVTGVFLALTCWSYLAVIFTSPGTPKEAAGAVEAAMAASANSNDDDDFGDHRTVPLPASLSAPSSSSASVAIKSNGEPRFCRKCAVPKPDRCHHCRICQRCVLKMDHHCPWVVNCIGYGNYKQFVLFLTYLALYCFSLLAFTVPVCLEGLPLNNDDDLAAATLIIGVAFTSAIFGLTLGAFAGYHLSLVLANQTTIESMEQQQYRMTRQRRQRAAANGHGNTMGGAVVVDDRDANPWDLGWRSNFVQVFGTSWWAWALPFRTTLGNGLAYPVNPKLMDSGCLTGQDLV
ncbi:DHHC palmitoyltransferase-domain-containing protein [Blastocladiella britannica]|nr:DHHC palmitoyltransferase-domain-containing protein [Blastocladiella britannica]